MSFGHMEDQAGEAPQAEGASYRQEIRHICQRDEAGQLDREAGEQLHVTVVQCGQCGPEGHCPRLGIENAAVFGPDCPGGGQARLA